MISEKLELMSGTASNDVNGTDRIVAPECVEVWSALGMYDFDYLSAIVCIHGRQKASRLNAMLNEG